MAASMAHRGPDGIGVWAEGPVGLAHCAMHTTPEAEYERQPLVDALSGCVVTADARIDNRDELLAKLKVVPADGEVITDIDFILAAYLRWGTSAPEHLIGDFAFAIWDPREQHLFCARDHIGINPFYYYAGPDFFVFGTEIKSLFVYPEVPREINDDRAAEFITRQPIDPEATMFQGILRLPPAHGMIVRRDGSRRSWRYFQFDPDYELVLSSDEEYEEAFREIFTEAVRCRLRSNGPVGVMLSGGLDSSSVACVARDLLREQGEDSLDTFTAEFGYEKADESRYLDSLREQGGFSMHSVPLNGASPDESLDRYLHHLDQPPYMCNVYMLDEAGHVARDNGVRVLLDGCEGDITVSYGLGRLGEMALNGKWDEVAHEVEALSRTFGEPAHRIFNRRVQPFLQARAALRPSTFIAREAWRLPASHRVSPLKSIWGYAIRPRLPERMLRAVGRPTIQPPEDKPFADLIDPKLFQRSRLEERVTQALREIPFEEYSERRQHWASLTDDAETVAVVQEEASHIHAMTGGEARHPFFDVRVAKFCLALPASQKLRDGYTRSIVRRALSHTLPDIIQKRMSKGDLGDNFYDQLITSSVIEKVISDTDGQLTEYFNSAAIMRAFENRDAPALWAGIGFMKWRTVSNAATETLVDTVSLDREPVSLS